MDLFEAADGDQNKLSSVSNSKDNFLKKPLAEILRPQSFTEFFNKEKIKGFSKPFAKLIDEGYLQNLILWGPPGCGKTTFAQLLETKIDGEFVSLNAVEAGVKVIKEIGEKAKRKRIEQQIKTVLFVDEIHRFNKGQQDVLLPFIEKGDFVLIGATTENPSYELNAALLSRCRLLVFSQHSKNDLVEILNRVAKYFSVELTDVISEEGQEYCFLLADGDARRLINLVEPIFLLNKQQVNEITWPVSAEEVEDLSGQKVIYHDKKSDSHYDLISAFIKSIRGSDADAGLYYLARMLEGGEDPVFIARRLVVLASEDVSNADPRALSLAIAGLDAVKLIGMPECAINLAQVVTYLACAPKSNRSYEGFFKAQKLVRQAGQLPVPLSLRQGNSKVLKDLGYGEGYKYSHNSEKGYVEQNFLPDEIKNEKFYQPSDHGFEKTIKNYVDWLKK